MRLPEHVIRRRQGLYLRLRLPSDLASLTGRSHVCRSLGTGGPSEVRGLAAARVAGLHAAWQRARVQAVATFRGKDFDDLTAEDVAALRADLPGALAEIETMPAEDRVRLNAVIQSIVKRLEREAFDLKVDREMARTVIDIGREARQSGIIQGMRDAITAGAVAQAARSGHRSRPAKGQTFSQAHPEAEVPWPTFIDRFYTDRPGMSESTLASYGQAFREWQAVIGDKHLADIRPRDVGRYSEWLAGKANSKGNTGKLNRKTIVRLLGHVKTFTEWALGKGLIAEDPGAGIEVREQTRIEKRADVDGPKRAFTAAELAKFFASPIYSGSRSLHYRLRPGPNVYRDSAWWLFVVALMTGARLDELATAPAELADIDGIACLDFRHGSKTFNAPRVVPVFPDLREVGFLEHAARQREAGRRLFEDESASDDWSKWTNRYLDSVLGEVPEIRFHSFRQMCSAALIGDYLADKLLGHRSKKDRSEGSGYGRMLSPDEARAVADKIRSPVPLMHLKA